LSCGFEIISRISEKEKVLIITRPVVVFVKRRETGSHLTGVPFPGSLNPGDQNGGVLWIFPELSDNFVHLQSFPVDIVT
jgi:hypothetical protein